MPSRSPKARAHGEGRKRKVPEVRREVSAGGLIWRRSESADCIEVVLVRPTGKSTWVLPKGHVEQGETLLDAAVREAMEESGLKVAPGEQLGQVSYLYSWRDSPADQPIRIFKRVHFYLMECVGGDPAHHDHEVDEVRWIPLEEAPSRASHKSERGLIVKARSILSKASVAGN